MDALKTWMQAAGETDATLAAKVELSRVQVTRIRNNTSRPSPEAALRLERVTGIPAATFIFGAAA